MSAFFIDSNWTSNRTLNSGDLYRNATLSLSEVAAWAAIQIVRCCAGITTSLLIIISFIQFKRLNNGTNFILCNMAVSNLLMDTMSVLGALVMLVRCYCIQISAKWCIGQGFFLFWFTFSSIYLLSSISVYQLVSVFWPRAHRRFVLKTLLMYFVVPCWVFPLPTVLLTAVGVLGEFKGREQYGFFCDYGPRKRNIATGVTSAINITLPMALLSLSLVGICYKLLRIRRVIAPESHVEMELKLRTIPQQINIERQRRILWSVFLPSAIFIVIYFTAFGVNRTYYNATMFDHHPQFFLWVRTFYHSATPVVAIIFALTNRDFREGFRYLCWGRKLKPLPASHARIAGALSHAA